MSASRKLPGFDMTIVIATLLLLTIGVLMVHSASSVASATKFNDPYFYAKRQLLWAILGLAGMFWFSKVDYHLLRSLAPKLLLISFVFLAIVLVPGVGQVRGGSRAWLGLGGFGIQPSEFAKLCILLFLAHFLADSNYRMPSFWRGFVPPLSVSVFGVGLIMLEPDLGQSVVIMGATLLLLIAAGSRWKHLSSLAGLAFIAFGALVAAAPYRITRIVSFLDPWKEPLGSGYQIIQSLFALGSGGMLGIGLGMSRQKYLYLPEPQTDFVFSILGEELGFLGAAAVLLLFGVLIWRGFRTAIYARDEFGTLLAVAITGMIGVQVLINIGVVTGSIPATGITLPFISYGGSSLTLALSSVGILLSVSRQAVFPAVSR